MMSPSAPAASIARPTMMSPDTAAVARPEPLVVIITFAVIDPPATTFDSPRKATVAACSELGLFCSTPIGPFARDAAACDAMLIRSGTVATRTR